MSYWPAVIEWFFWLLPYASVLAIVVWAWPELKGMRSAQIRSVCVSTMIFVVAYSLGQFNPERMPFEDQTFILAILGMLGIVLISWQADRARLKFLEFELEMNRKARADSDYTEQETDS